MSDIVTRNKFIDRIAEEELFKTLLRFEGDKRVLVINDRGGRGKSHLLKRLAYVCWWESKPRVAVSRIELDKTEPSLIRLVGQIRKDLGECGLEFRTYDRLDAARILERTDAFGPGFATGVVNAPGFSAHDDAQVAGIIANTRVENARDVHITAGATAWSPEMKQRAADETVQAFLSDLRGIVRETPVVLLLDSVDEKAPRALRDWTVQRLALACCLDDSWLPHKLILVLAGREPLDLVEIPAVADRVESIKALTAWEKEHVKKFLDLNGCEGASDSLVQILTEKLAERETTLDTALNLARILHRPGIDLPGRDGERRDD